MLGKRGPQRGLFEADTAYGAFVGRDSFYGWLVSRRELAPFPSSAKSANRESLGWRSMIMSVE